MRTPTFAYPGAKARLAKTIVSFFPEGVDTYIEPFVGRGNVFFSAATHRPQFCKRWVLNDIATAPFFHALLAVENPFVPVRSREAYYQNWEASKAGDKNAVLLEPYLTFGGGGYGTGGPCTGNGATEEGYKRSLQAARQCLLTTNAEIKSLPWEELFASEILDEKTFVYLDPPYYNADVRAYKSTAFDYKRLLDWMLSTKAKWLLSEYPAEFYLTALGKPAWTKSVQLVGTNFTYPVGGASSRLECLWKNF